MRSHTKFNSHSSRTRNTLSESNGIDKLRSRIRKILFENETGEVKPGTASVESEGTLNVKKIADALGMDPVALSTAVRSAKNTKEGQNRKPETNRILADVFIKLMNAGTQDTTTAMAAFKAVSDKDVPKDKDQG